MAMASVSWPCCSPCRVGGLQGRGGRVRALKAREEQELSAAAFLRARCFYSYPEGRSIQAQEAHQNYMAQLECTTLISKTAGIQHGFQKVTCLTALCSLTDLGLEPDNKLAEVCKVSIPEAKEELLVVGTLDLNQGRHLPNEIPGSRPKDPEAAGEKRAYISNLCVAGEVRRTGVGTALVEEAKRIARGWGVSDLYVHVVLTNLPAARLYEKAGFVFEVEEGHREAHLLQRPRRKLLWFGIHGTS